MHNISSLAGLVLGLGCLFSARVVNAASCNADKPTISSTLSSSTSKTSSSTSSTPTCAPTPANNVVRNGGFECGLSPWIAADVVNTRHSITSPGDDSAFAFQFNQVGPVDPNGGSASVSQDISVVVGRSYNLRFRTFFDKCTQGEGFIGVMINHQALQTIDACDFGTSDFKFNYPVSFTATTNPTNLRFELITGEEDTVAKIDNVVVVPS
ncbi:MAG: hypothetical protein Q9194_006517 [Teloschistes cf. exilis]